MKTWAVLAFLLTLTACGSESLADRDPAGAEACKQMASYSERTNPEVALGGMLVVGEAASLADTEAIAASAEELAGTGKWMADYPALHAACEDEGVDMPALPKT